MKPLLQVAIDVLDLDKAIEIAEISFISGADIIEVGTPLIKKYGIVSIKEIKARLPRTKIYADMKIIDAAEQELKIAYEAGADIVSVLASSHDYTIFNAISFGKRFGLEICVDLIGIKNVVGRTMEISYMNPDYICYHIPIDFQQNISTNLPNVLKVIKELSRTIPIPIAVAGGIDLTTAPLLANSGASIIIIGRSITREKDIASIVKKIKSNLSSSTL